MDIFWKTSAGVLTALILWVALSKYSKDISVLLTTAVCVMGFFAAFSTLRPVINFIRRVQSVGGLDGELLSVLLKAVGIGLISEICVLICKDAGNEAMGKALGLLSTVTILWISIPVFDKLLSLLDKILGAV